MYDLVAGIHCLKSSYVLSKSKALELFPMLNKDKLVGAIVYYDGESNSSYGFSFTEMQTSRFFLSWATLSE